MLGVKKKALTYNEQKTLRNIEYKIEECGGLTNYKTILDMLTLKEMILIKMCSNIPELSPAYELRKKYMDDELNFMLIFGDDELCE